VRDLIETHERLTGSRVARALLRNDPSLSTMFAIRPRPDAAVRHDAVDATEERAVNA
jgi:hypothetical protein